MPAAQPAVAPSQPDGAPEPSRRSDSESLGVGDADLKAAGPGPGGPLTATVTEYSDTVTPVTVIPARPAQISQSGLSR